MEINDGYFEYDSEYGEPDLSKYIGFDDCKNCYFRVSNQERITELQKKLHRKNRTNGAVQ